MTLLDDTLAALPAPEHGPLLLGPGMQRVPATRALEEDWLAEQVRLRGLRWGTDDRRVLATLWWYSASVWVQVPALASYALTGRALSPLPQDVQLHWRTDSTINGATSTREVDDLAGALRECYASIITPLARVGAMREGPLWAIASDSLANRLLWVAKATGSLARTTALAAPLAAAIGRPLPAPRYVDVRSTRYTRRSSCCLLYEAPRQDKCSSCPKLSPTERARNLDGAAAREQSEA